ncbi:MAG: hydroxymethylglutaryl-CoA synthase family protein, partial [Saprospiraceae bacterium]|nr:hydroxymethylglutaryl-CoA synthase family protein [Saprospiraceae bacterium]
MSKVGIEAISYYVPQLYLDLEDLADARGIEYLKLNKGLGLSKMAVPDVDEDAASFAANALLNIIIENHIDPRSIGRIYLGTESALDAAKPTITYAIKAVEDKLESKFGERCFKNCDVVDMTFACVGAVDAMHNSLDWVSNGSNRKAVVIASDIAKYDLKSTGEYTQGAGSVAVLITKDPGLLTISPCWGVATRSVGDFFKPRRVFDKVGLLVETAQILGRSITREYAEEILNNSPSKFWDAVNDKVELFKEEPVFDGPYSNECYKERIDEAFEHFNMQSNTNVIEDWQHLVFHLPYAFQARRMIFSKWLSWSKENGDYDKLLNEVGPPNKDDMKSWLKAASKSHIYKSFVKSRITSGERASSEIGNMYTASIFMSLLSVLSDAHEKGADLTNHKIGFFSYGSGSKSKVFEGEIQQGWQKKLRVRNLFDNLDTRTRIDMETYERLHNNMSIDAISNGISARLV